MWNLDTGCLDITSIHEQYRIRNITPSQLVKSLLKRIDDGYVRDKIWISLVPAHEVIKRTQQLDAILTDNPAILEQQPLFGIPFAVKDNFDVAGMETTAACPDHVYVADETALVIQLLVNAGAILLGKTNMDQFATGLVGTRSPYGTPVNPFNADYLPGGSSSGSAVAVSKGLVSFTLGTDTAGSGRVPAAFNNIVGYKPTRGMLSTRGVFPACRSLDCVSVFALNTADVYTITACMAKFDKDDPYCRHSPVEWDRLTKLPVEQLRIGVPDMNWLEFFGDKYTGEQYKNTISLLEKQGNTVITIDFKPFRDVARLLYEGPWIVERQIAFGHLFSGNEKTVNAEVRDAVSKAGHYKAEDVFTSFYRLKEFRRQIENVFAGVDCLVLPTAGRIFTIAEAADSSLQVNQKLGYYTNFVNLLDLCAYAVPAGFLPNGLPFGVTYIAPAFSDASILDAGNSLHCSLGLNMGASNQNVSPWARKPAQSDGRIKIGLCGAHMKGLSLNYQMLERHAQYVCTTHTCDTYRLYSLEKMDPPRPGLVRTGEGGEIELEIWEMSAEDFGKFVASIPSPLSIGTLQLTDGESVKGFLCEDIAVQDAKDITGYGGWRSYLAR